MKVLQSLAIIALLLVAAVCQPDSKRSGFAGPRSFPGGGGFFPPGGFPFPGNPGGIPITVPPIGGGGSPFPGGFPIGGNPGSGNAGSGDTNADFSVDLDSGLESAINTILGKASDGGNRVQSFAQARSQPPDSDVRTAEQRSGKNFAALRASGGPAGAAGGVSAARCSGGYCGTPYPPPCSYCYNPCWSCPTFRPRLYCSVTYYPTWRLCCWIVWWWY